MVSGVSPLSSKGGSTESSSSPPPSAVVAATDFSQDLGIRSASRKRSASDSSSKASSAIPDIRRSSTEEYGHIPFDEFSVQVRQLCEQTWPSSSTALQSTSTSREFLIERLKGGGCNRIFGIKVLHPDSGGPTDLILRVPRFDSMKHDSEVTILRFVRQCTLIPVPEIVFADSTSNNLLKQPYTFQSRIFGHDLQTESKPSWYPNLSHAQKCTVARDFAKLLQGLHFVTHPYPGEIEASPGDSSRQTYRIRPFRLNTALDLPGLEQDLNIKLPFFQACIFDPKHEPADRRPFEQTTYYFMLVQFGRWKALQLRCDPASIAWSRQYDDLVTAAEQMDDLFELGDSENCLCHLDLNTAPRNIMADIHSDGDLKVSGILDWDSAVFAPRYVGCAPPMWLWAWSDEEEDEEHANDKPSTLEQSELKHVFEETIGDWFLEYAYKQEYRMARKLFYYAVHGIQSSTEKEEAEKFLDEWTAFYTKWRSHTEEDKGAVNDISTETSAPIDDYTGSEMAERQ